jgi:hypothetical protein
MPTIGASNYVTFTPNKCPAFTAHLISQLSEAVLGSINYTAKAAHKDDQIAQHLYYDHLLIRVIFLSGFSEQVSIPNIF